MVYGNTMNPVTFHYSFNAFLVGDQAWYKAPTAGPTAGVTPTQSLPSYSGNFYSQYVKSNRLPVRITRPSNPTACVLITEDGQNMDALVELPPGRIHAAAVHNIRGHRASDPYTYMNADNAVCTFMDGHTESVAVDIVDAVNPANVWTIPTDNTGCP